MHVGAMLAVALVMSLLGSLFGLPQRTVAAAPARPDIVMFYIDDWAPYPDRMWNKPKRTPELAKFANNGIEFSNAIASTPLCGPARANLLTGKYGHRSGVTLNDIGPYTGRKTVATKLRKNGYRTAFVGKHINGISRDYPTRSRMATLSKRWDQFDVIWHNQGRFYGWRQYRKDGTRSFARASTDHSTYQATMRAVHAIEATRRGKPLFLVLSLFDGHKPMTPMPRFRNHPLCQSFKPWQGPAYNEADVSDKPSYVRKRPKREQASFDLQNRCEQAMTVDWAVGKVRKALKRAGRMEDTLQIITADNGVLYGDHRLVGKTYPYAAHVPLFVRWPAVTGYKKRVVTEPVSNVDFGRTFCVLAGCTMPDSDGKSLVSLIRGTRQQLDRPFIYAELLHAGPEWGISNHPRPAWIEIDSTLAYSSTLWSYTRYQTGEEELYDVSTDPHKLRNLAGKGAHAGVLADLRGYWRSIRDRDGVTWKGKLRH